MSRAPEVFRSALELDAKDFAIAFPGVGQSGNHAPHHAKAKAAYGSVLRGSIQIGPRGV